MIVFLFFFLNFVIFLKSSINNICRYYVVLYISSRYYFVENTLKKEMIIEEALFNHL